MDALTSVFTWIGNNEAVLSGAAALFLMIGLVLSPLRARVPGMIRRWAGTSGDPTAASPAMPATPAADDASKPVVAVLPLDNMSGDTDQEFFADGITEDIITELSRFSGLAVIARNSSFTYKGQAVKVQDVARDLGAHYVVEGSVRRAEQKVRITVQLIDAKTGEHVWAERYDRDLDNIFDLQDEITRTIVAVLPGRVEADRADRASRMLPADMKAYDYLVRGKIHHHNFTAADNAAAQQCLNKAIELEPNYAQAHAWKACVLGQAWSRGYATDSDDPMDIARAAIAKAYSIDEADPECHRLLSAVSLIEKEFDKASEHQARGLALSPNYDLIVVQQGELLTWTGHGDEGAEWVHKAMLLNPFHPPRYWSHLGRALFVAGHHANALDAFRKNTMADAATYALMAACSAYLGDEESAKRYAAKVMDMQPDFRVGSHVAGLPYQSETDADHHRQGLIKAGLAA